MKFTKTPIEGLLILDPAVYTDDRGFFFESFSARQFNEACPGVTFVQDNQSVSSKDVLRGLHFQWPPHAQGKLVRVVQGSAVDVAVDIRSGSPTWGQHVAVELTASNHRMFWIPPGFAHGFEALEDNTVFLYKCTDYYDKASERGIRYDDPALQIKWRTAKPVVSGKDLELPPLGQIKFPV